MYFIVDSFVSLVRAPHHGPPHPQVGTARPFSTYRLKKIFAIARAADERPTDWAGTIRDMIR